MNPLVRSEIELKFPLENPSKIRKQLIDLGFISQGRVFEFNLVFDTPRNTLAKSGCLLRLRRDKTVKLTYKEPPPQESALNHRFKVKTETELEVSDFDSMRHILHRLGFTRERIYEKYREHLMRDDGVSAEIDHLPYLGDFLELEAIPEKIEEVAVALGLDPARGLRENYFQLFAGYCKKEGLEITDLVFKDNTTG